MSKKLSKVPKKYQNKPLYSISKLQTYEQCPWSYYQSYILKNKGIDNIYNLIGQEVHEIIELLQRKKISNDEAIKMYNNKILEMEIRDIKFPSEKIAINYNECLIDYFNRYVPIKAKKIKMEKEFYAKILKWIFRGFIDIIVEDNNGNIKIMDYKTSSMYAKKDIDKYGLQLILYAIALEKNNKIPINSVGWNFLKYANVKSLETGKIKEKILRNEIVKEYYDEMINQLKREGFQDFEIEIVLSKKEIHPSIEKYYEIKDCIIEYQLSEENKTKFFDFIDKTIPKIEDKKNEFDFPPIEINEKTSFFCNTLCGQREICKFLQQYKDNYKKEEQDKIKEALELFG